MTQTFTPEEIRDGLAAPTQPLALEVVERRVTNTARDRRGSRGQVVAYADQWLRGALLADALPAHWASGAAAHSWALVSR